MVQTTQRNFTGGEIAPALRSRADLAKYTSGLALCENMFVRSQGGVYSRQGTKYICELDDSSAQGRLIAFQFNTEQTYILIFENLQMRVIKDGGVVQSGGSDYTLTTPYTTADLARLQFTQSADVMTIVHPDYSPRNLNRLADDNWTLTTIDFSPTIEPPAYAADATATITNATQANPCVITTDAAHGFSTGDEITITDVVGMVELNNNEFIITVLSSTTFSLNGIDSTAYTAYTSDGTATRGFVSNTGDPDGGGDYEKTYSYVITAVDSNGVESLASSVATLTCGSLSQTYGVRLNWSPVSNAAYYRVYKDPSDGTNIYGWIGDSKTTQFIDFNVAPLTSDSPPLNRDPFTTVVATITDIDNTDRTLVTAADHGFNTGDTVLIEDVDAPTDFNDQEFSIEVVDDDSFYLIHSIVGPFASYTSGGTATKQGSNPSTVNYYQQRRVYANTDSEPQTVFTSQTGIYDSLRTSSPARDADAVTFTINSKEVNEIRHLIELDSLIILTSGGEYRVTEGQNEVLTPSSVGLRKQSNNGASWVSPVIIHDTIIFLQEKGGRVRDINYEFIDNKYKGNDLSIMAEHLFEGYTITDMAYSAEPYSILWCIRSDGRLIGLTYQRDHQIWAWHQHVSATSAGDSEFESIAVISEDGRDAPYCIVKRTINGSTVRYVERLEPRYTSAPEDVWCVDCGLNYNGSAATTISGLSHLIGEEVAVVADGNVVTGLTVSPAGKIELPRAASIVTVGLGFTPAIELLDLDVGSISDTLKGKDVSVSRVIIEVEKSRGLWVGPKKDDGSTGDMREIKPRHESDAYSPIQLKTRKEEVRIEPQWSLGGGIRIEQRGPMPLAILSVIPEVDVS